MSGRMVAFAATFFVPVVLARILSQAEFGTYKQLFLLYGTLYYIAQLGMAESLFYFLPSASRQAGRYVANAMLFLTVTGLGCRDSAARGRASTRRVAEQSGAGDATSPGSGRSWADAGVERARDRDGRPRALSAGVDLLRRLRSAPRAVSSCCRRSCFAGSTCCSSARSPSRPCGWSATLVYLARTFAGGSPAQTRARSRRQLRYTLPFGLATVLEICQANLHLYAVSYYVDAATFAIYAVGCLQIPVVDLVATSAGNVMMVRMAEGAARGRPGPRTAWRSGARPSRHLALGAGAGGRACCWSRLTRSSSLLFTDQYAAAVPIFMIWSLAILPAIFMTDAALRVYAQTRFLVVLNAIRLGVIAVLILWSMSTFGLAGAVMLTLVAAVLTKVLALMRVARVHGGVGPRALVPWASLGAHRAGGDGGGRDRRWLPAWCLAGAACVAITAAVYAGVYLALIWRLDRADRTRTLRLWNGCSGGPDKPMCGIAGIVSLSDRGVELAELRGHVRRHGPSRPEFGRGLRRARRGARHAAAQRHRSADRRSADLATKTARSGSC